jgi:hypothetical protein
MRRPSWILFPLYLSLSFQISLPLSRLHSQISLPSFFLYLSPHSPSFNLSHSSHAVSGTFFSLSSPCCISPISFISPDFLLTVCILQSSLSIFHSFIFLGLYSFPCSILFSLFPPFSFVPCLLLLSPVFKSLRFIFHLFLGIFSFTTPWVPFFRGPPPRGVGGLFGVVVLG